MNPRQARSRLQRPQYRPRRGGTTPPNVTRTGRDGRSARPPRTVRLTGRALYGGCSRRFVRRYPAGLKTSDALRSTAKSGRERTAEQDHAAGGRSRREVELEDGSVVRASIALLQHNHAVYPYIRYTVDGRTVTRYAGPVKGRTREAVRVFQGALLRGSDAPSLSVGQARDP